MYDEDVINDSLKFVKQIKFYTNSKQELLSSTSLLFDNVKRDELLQEALKCSLNISDDKDNVIGAKKEDGILDCKDRAAEIPDSVRVEENEGRAFKDWIYIVLCISVSFILVFALTRYVAHHTYVQGSSMNETLHNGDVLMVEKISYYLHEPERFDIVTFRYSDDVNYIKRIIGLPGEKVQIINGYVYINDRLLEEDVFGNEIIQDAGIAKEAVLLGDNQYFVLGDNRNSSIDSRRDSVGMVNVDEFDGKAVFRILPPADFGSIK